MLAVFAYDRPDGSTLIAIDGNGGLTDLYLRGSGGGVQVATNPEFFPTQTVDEQDWVNPTINSNLYAVDGENSLYITNATPNQREIPLSEATGFAVGDTARTTDFVLSNGNIDLATPGGFAGRLTYDGNTWTFVNDLGGKLRFTLESGAGAGPAPVDDLSFVTAGLTQLDNRGAGLRGTVSVRWTAPVSTYFATSPTVDEASYSYVGTSAALRNWSEFDVGVSAGGQVTFALPDNAVPKDAFGGESLRGPGGGVLRVPGTTSLSGTITVYDVSPSGIPGAATQNLAFGFATDPDTGAFVFTPRQNDWLEIAAGSTPTALRFVNRYDVVIGNVVTPAGSVNVQPGRVTIEGGETWFEYTEEATASALTVWAGFDVGNAIEIDTTRIGSSFNVLSPIVSAPSISVLGTTNVNFEAPVSATGGITLGTSELTGALVNTALFDAPVAAASYSMTVAGGSLTVSPSGSLSGALPDASGGVSTAAGSVTGRMIDADFFVQGTIFATTQFYDLNNEIYTRPNLFTTRSPATGLDSGLVRGATVVINLAASGAGADVPDPTNADTSYHEVDLRTQIDTLRTRAAGSDASFAGTSMYPYVLSIRENDAITFDAVAGSSRPISLAAGGAMTMASGLDTLSDVSISATGQDSSFTVSAPIQTRFGAVDISASSVTVRNSIQVTNAAVYPSKDDITITATNGDIIGQNLIAAVNNVSLVQRKAGSGSRIDVGGIRARSVTVNAVGDVTLGTTVETLSGSIGGGFWVRETDDIAIPSLRAGGRVAISAAGIDGGTTTANPIALMARIDDVTAIEVSTPNGSADVVVNTPKLLTVGGATSPAIANMLAAGNVTVRSTAGDLRLLDAPLAGGNARVVKAASTGVLPAVYAAGTPNVTAGTLTGIGSINGLGRFDGQSLAVGDRVLVRLGSTGTTNSNGVYTVARTGGGVGINANWQLTRASDSDTAAELGSGSYVKVATGNTLSGTLWQISYLAFPTTSADLSSSNEIEIPVTYVAMGQLSIGQRVRGAGLSANATIAAIDPTTGVITLSAGAVSNAGGSAVVTFVAPDLGQSPITATPTVVATNIGSDVIGKSAAFIVSSAGGTNSAAGSLGKMLLVRQQNNTSTSANPDQAMSFNVASLSGPIRLTQELPVIQKAFAINGSSAFIDGSRIVTTRNGVPTTAGSVINGFEFVAGSGATTDTLGNPQAGASLSGFTLAGFAKGAAVKIDGVPGILVSGVTLGRDSAGQRLANRQGIVAAGAGTTSATVLNTSIFSSTDAGLVVESGASGVKVVGSTIGAPNLNNSVGVRFASTGGSQIGVEPAAPTAAIPSASVRLTQGSASFTLPSAYAARAALYVGLGVRGTGIPVDAVITAINLVSGVVTISAAATTTGSSNVSFGNFVATTVGERSLTLPAGVAMGSLFLGQPVTGVGIPAGARIAAIDVTTRLITLTAAMTATGITNVLFGIGGRVAISSNLQGVLLSAGSNTITNTDIYSNAYDGVVITGGTQQIGKSKSRSTTSNAIYANGGFGIRQQNATIAAQQKIWGNYIGMQVNGTTSRPNTAGSVTPARAVNATTKLDADGNQYGPARASSTSGGGGGGGSGGSSGGARPPSPIFPLR